MKPDSKPPPIRQYYTVKLEVVAPMTLTYRVLAESPEQALELAAQAPLSQAPRPHLSKMKKLKASIYLAGTTLLQLIKNF
jgi:hypothetical protein